MRRLLAVDVAVILQKNKKYPISNLLSENNNTIPNMGKGSCLCKAIEFQYGGEAMNKASLSLNIDTIQSLSK